MPLHAGSTPAGSWTIVEQGSFLIGRCEGCGFVSAARRARFSAESDMRAHELLCRQEGSSEQTADEPAGAPSSAGAPEVAAGPGLGASGRERLSAQGRS